MGRPQPGCAQARAMSAGGGTVRYRPMEKKKVDLIQSEPPMVRIKGAQCLVIAVIAVPQLCRDENLFAKHQSGDECTPIWRAMPARSATRAMGSVPSGRLQDRQGAGVVSPLISTAIAT
jgi:hypothetical protein